MSKKWIVLNFAFSACSCLEKIFLAYVGRDRCCLVAATQMAGTVLIFIYRLCYNSSQATTLRWQRSLTTEIITSKLFFLCYERTWENLHFSTIDLHKVTKCHSLLFLWAEIIKYKNNYSLRREHYIQSIMSKPQNNHARKVKVRKLRHCFQHDVLVTWFLSARHEPVRLISLSGSYNFVRIIRLWDKWIITKQYIIVQSVNII